MISTLTANDTNRLIEELNTIIGSADFGNKTDEPFNPYRSPYQTALDKIKEVLNQLFPTCINVIYTKNTDKQFFGVYVNPTVTNTDVTEILFIPEPIKIQRYMVELDSKLFDIGLDSREITALILNEVSAMMETAMPVERLRDIINLMQTDMVDDVVSISKSMDQAQLMIFAIKDSLHKLTSCFYTDSDSGFYNKFINSNDLSVSLGNALEKILSSTFGLYDTVRNPKLMILQWVFSVYKDLPLMQKTAIRMLEECRFIVGSKLVLDEINKTIKSLYRIPSVVQNESARILQEAKGGLFNSLKQNGLRAIEDDLYEYRVRSKNSETEDDAMYTLRQINTRINIIDEYLYRNEGTLSIAEKERWESLAAKYRELREEISRKTVSHKKQYGLYYDYDKI